MAKNNKKFTETPIPLLGGKHYFNRCPVETLTIFDKKIENLMKSFEPLEKESNKLVEEVEFIQNKINTLNKKIELIDKKEDPTDDELNFSIEALDKQDKLYDELKKARQAVEDFDDENRDVAENFKEQADRIVAEKVEAMFSDISADDFLQQYDAIDMRIAQNISTYYEMCMLGEREAVIQKQILEDSNASRARVAEFQRR